MDYRNVYLNPPKDVSLLDRGLFYGREIWIAQHPYTRGWLHMIPFQTRRRLPVILPVCYHRPFCIFQTTAILLAACFLSTSSITLTDMHPSQHMAPYCILHCRQHTKPCSDVTNYHHRHQMSGHKNPARGEIKESKGGDEGRMGKKKSSCRSSDGRRQCQAGEPNYQGT